MAWNMGASCAEISRKGGKELWKALNGRTTFPTPIHQYLFELGIHRARHRIQDLHVWWRNSHRASSHAGSGESSRHPTSLVHLSTFHFFSGCQVSPIRPVDMEQHINRSRNRNGAPRRTRPAIWLRLAPSPGRARILECNELSPSLLPTGTQVRQ